MKVNQNEDWMQTHFLNEYRPYGWISVCGFLLYFQTFFFDFIYYDDNIVIIENYHFISQLKNIPTAFTQVFWEGIVKGTSYYRPILTSTFIFDTLGNTTNPQGIPSAFRYHLSNVIFHLIACCLFFIFLKKLNFKKELAFLCVLIFTVHPLLSQSVSWIGGRNDTLLGIFILSSFIFYLNYLKEKKVIFLIPHLLFFLMALLTKESAIAFPIICFLYVVLVKNTKTNYAMIFFWILVIAAWFFIQKYVTLGTSISQVSPAAVLKSIVIHSPALLLYIGKTFLPLNLSVMPVFQNSSFIFAIIAISFIGGVFFFTKEKNGMLIFFGICWFLLFITPTLITSNPSADDNFVVRDDRMYLPMMGILMVSLEIPFLKKINFQNKRIWNYVFLIVALLAMINFSYSKNFKNRLSFWKAAAKHSPDNAAAHLHLGDMYLRNESFDKAIDEYKKCFQINPYELIAHNNLGVLYMRQNKLKEAEEEFKKELMINPNYEKSLFNLGLIYSQQGRSQEAELIWLKSIAINPSNIDVYKNLVIYYLEQKNIGKATFYVKELQNRNVPIPPEILKALK